MSLEQNLRQEQVDSLELSDYISVEIGTSVRSVVEQMRSDNHNCAIVTDRGVLTGIFTDHDILIKIADNPETWNLPIDDFVRPSPFTVNAKDSLKTALTLMDEKQFRNVPVLDDDGNLVGNLTHHALVDYLTSHVSTSD
jgi:CBS domain-containing protein